MRVYKFVLPLLALALVTAQTSSAQAPVRVQVQSGPDHPIYRITVNVVERTTTAIVSGDIIGTPTSARGPTTSLK